LDMLTEEHAAALAAQADKHAAAMSAAQLAAQHAAQTHAETSQEQLETSQATVREMRHRAEQAEKACRGAATEIIALRASVQQEQEGNAELLRKYNTLLDDSRSHRSASAAHAAAVTSLEADLETLSSKNSQLEDSLKHAQSKCEQLRTTHRAEMQAERERIFAMEEELEAHLATHGERLAIAEESGTGRRANEANILRQRLVAQDESHAKAIEEHLKAEEKLWKDNEAHTRASVEAEVLLGLSKRQLAVAQTENKELVVLQKLQGEEIAGLQAERTKLQAAARALEVRCVSAEAAAEVAEEANANAEALHMASIRPRLEALQRRALEAAASAEQARTAHDAQVAEMKLAAERASKVHAQQLAAVQKCLEDAQQEAKQRLADLSTERLRLTSAQKYQESVQEKHSAKLLDAQRREIVMQQQLDLAKSRRCHCSC
jgi:colicin import membrane protein